MAGKALKLPVVYIGVPTLPPYKRSMVVHRRWGLIGAQIIRSVSSTREWTVPATVTDHDTEAKFWAAIVTMDRMQDEAASGSLYLRGIEYPNVTFQGWEPKEEPFLEGSGRKGWTQRGHVRFLQRRPKLIKPKGGQS